MKGGRWGEIHNRKQNVTRRAWESGHIASGEGEASATGSSGADTALTAAPERSLRESEYEHYGHVQH